MASISLPLESARPVASPASFHGEPPRASYAPLYERAARSRDAAEIGAIFQALAPAWGTQAPLPGSGRTLERWRMLAEAGSYSLPLVKLLEAHLDALAILAELAPGHEIAAADTWGVWCAEPPHRQVIATPAESAGRSSVRLHGTKPWCSGAVHVSHALVSVWDEDGRPYLAAVKLDDPDVRIAPGAWAAVGMGPTATADLMLDGARAFLVGGPGAYVSRPGFLHGAVGVAACWHGAAAAIGAKVREAVRKRPDDTHAAAHLGAIDVALSQAAEQFRLCARAIDAAATGAGATDAAATDASAAASRPAGRPATQVARTRLAVEAAVETVLQRAPRALGPAPFCMDARLAGLLADLPIYVRQSHAERDLAAHGLDLANEASGDPWML
jgi:hypothetical protein